MNKDDIFMVIFAFLLIITLSSMFYYTTTQCGECSKLVTASERLAMYNKSLKTYSGANGLYYPTEEFYCVWVEGRTTEEIKSTEDHEICHALIDKDYEHFCRGEE